MDELKILFDFGLSGLAIFAIILLVRSQSKANENQSSLIKVVGQQDTAYSKLNNSIDANTKATEAQTKAVEAGQKLTSTAANEITKTGDRVQQLADAVTQMNNDQQASLSTYSQEIPRKVFENSSKLANDIIRAVEPIPEQILALSGKLDSHARELANARGVIEGAPEAITVMVVARLSGIIGSTQRQLEQLSADVQGLAIVEPTNES